MFHSDKPALRPPPPFGPPAPRGPPFGFRGPCSVPPPGHLPPGPCGPFPTSALDSRYLHNTPPGGHFIRPHCSSFSIDHSTAIALGGSRQIVPPAEPSHHQVPQWNPPPIEHHPSDNSDRAGEEFLRCIADNKPLPDYLKGNMAYNLAEAFKSANVLKEAMRTDLPFQKQGTKRKSHSRSRSRSRGRSRGRSRAKSRARSKSRVRSQSRGRSKSRVRGKSQARSKSKPRSRSRSHSRGKKTSHVRSKSRARRSKSRSGSSEKDNKRKRSPGHSSSDILKGNSLLEGLKMVMNSKELEARLPTLKDAILTIKGSDESKTMGCVSDEQHDNQENSTSLENDSMLLPHDRVVSDFSWLQGKSQEDFSRQRANELEDEESFLYGNQSWSQSGERDKLQEMAVLGSQQLQQSTLFSSFGKLLDLKQPLQGASSALASSSLEGIECEKIRNILKSLEASSGSSETMKKEGREFSPARLSSDTAASVALPALRNPNVRQALESLQSLIKATKEKRTRGDDTHASCDKQKAANTEDRKREKQATISKMESLAKQLEELLKQDGVGFLTPVIGFYCQKCEEFIGDLNSAENHAAIHRNSDSSSQNVQMDKHTKDSKGHTHHCSPTRNRQPSDSRHHRDYGNHRNSGDQWNSRDFQRNWKDEKDHRSKHPSDDHRSHRAGQDNVFLQEEMKRERMLITVSRGLIPSPLNIRAKEEANKEVNKKQAIESQSKVKAEDADSKGKSCKDSRGKDRQEKSDSSDSSDSDQEISSISKQPKKKKKKKDKKKKKKKKKEKTDKS